MSKTAGLRYLGIGAIAFVAIGLASPTWASISFTAGVGDSPVAGVSYVNFDNLIPPAGGVSGGVTVTFSGNGQSVVGPIVGVAAPPVLSNNQGANFGPQPDGVDTTPYISTGDSSPGWTLTLPGKFNYFGLLWGSVDGYNTLEFFNGGVLVGTILGSDPILAPANGNQGVPGTVYLNAFSTLLFDTIVGSSTSFAFEADDAAFGNVPEPGTLTLFGLGLLGLGLLRRRRAATHA